MMVLVMAIEGEKEEEFEEDDVVIVRIVAQAI